jgi:hypothetical protein
MGSPDAYGNIDTGGGAYPPQGSPSPGRGQDLIVKPRRPSYAPADGGQPLLPATKWSANPTLLGKELHANFKATLFLFNSNHAGLLLE